MENNIVNPCFHNVKIGALITFLDTDGEQLKGHVINNNHLDRIYIQCTKNGAIDYRTILSREIDERILLITQYR